METERKSIQRRTHIIGVDIGGTKIAAGLVNDEFQLLDRIILPTPSSKHVGVVMEQIYKSIDVLLTGSDLDESGIAGIGVVAPGPLNPQTGVIISAPNIPALRNVPLLECIQQRFGLPTLVENDANAAGLAEALFGAGVGYKIVFYVTVSTGIGTGIILDRRIYTGKNGAAAEGGHIPLDYEGRLCGCGRRGCIEAYASGPALTRRTLERLSSQERPTKILELAAGDLKQVTPVVVSQAAQQGDQLAVELIQETGQYLGIWLGAMVTLLDPDIIIIGGGLTSIGDLLFDAIRRTLPDRCINPFVRDLPIVPARLRSDVGIMGAAALHLGYG